MRSLVLTIVLSCSVFATHLADAWGDVRPVESEIYAAFLNKLAQDASVASKPIVIRESTGDIDMLSGVVSERAKEIWERLPEASATVVADLIRRIDVTARVVIVPQHIRPTTSYAMMSDQTYIQIFAEDSEKQNWQRFQTNFPKSKKAFFQFSRVGYDPQSKQALVYVRFLCFGGTCGGGWLMLYELKWGRWVEIKQELWAIS